MLKADFHWNDDADLQRISEGIDSLNQQLDDAQQEQIQEQAAEGENDEPEIKWPSISDR